MHRKGRAYNITWFLGLVATLFLAVAPAIAPALSMSSISTSSKGNYIEICTAFGIVKMAVADDFAMPGHNAPDKNYGGKDHGDKDHGDTKSNHCLLCNLRNLAFTLPQAPVLPVPDMVFTSLSALPDTKLSAAPPALPYHSRAPPFFLS